MGPKKTGTCVGCSTQKRKCSKTVVGARKPRKTAGEARDTSESSQGAQSRERADTLRAPTRAMGKMSVAEIYDSGAIQRARRTRKRSPSPEADEEPSESGSSAKRKRDESPVPEASMGASSPEVDLGSTHWEVTPPPEPPVTVHAGGAMDVETTPQNAQAIPAQVTASAAPSSQEEEWREEQRGRFAQMGAELQHAAEILLEERRRASEERARTNQALRGVAHSLVGLQCALRELEAATRRKW